LRYAVRAEVSGSVIIRQPFNLVVGDIRTDFESDETGRLSAVVVSTEVRADDFKSTLGPGVGLSKATITMNADSAATSRLLKYLQSLEANLSFSSGSLKRIHWDTPKQERIPETDEERQYATVSSIGLSFKDPRPRVILLPNAATALVTASLKENDYLVVPKAFWHEAMNEYADRRYIQAYYNFYFVIEGLFGNGKSSEVAILKAFQQSAEMAALTRWALQFVQSKPSHWESLLQFYVDLGCTTDLEGTQRLLVRLRGSLHHYSIKSSKGRLQPNPLSQNGFLSPAWLAMCLATRALEGRDSDLPHAKPIEK
jgi:hypothetical protein